MSSEDKVITIVALAILTSVTVVGMTIVVWGQ